MRTATGCAMAAAAGLGLLGCFFLVGMGLFFPFEALAHLLMGWLLFPLRVVPEVTVSAPDLVEFAGVLALFTFGIHHFARWFVHAGDRGSWSLRRTLALVAAVLLMFVTSIASAGLAHQAAWLSRTKNTESNWAHRQEERLLQESCDLLAMVGYTEHLVAELGRSPEVYGVPLLHHVPFERVDQLAILIFPRKPSAVVELGGQLCLSGGDSFEMRSVEVAPDQLEAALADPWGWLAAR